MFGYVRAEVSELRVKEHEYYKGTYCGLCKAMGKCTGQCSRMSLNYDFTLFALLRIALAGEVTSFSQERCVAHPLKKRNVMKRNAELDYSAYASAILTYHKVMDDIADSAFPKRLFLRLFVLPTARRMRRRALKSSEELRLLDRSCAELLGKISALEKENCKSADIPAALFGELLSELLSHGLGGSEKRIAASIGKSVGRWIYIADALDDVDEDIRTGNYNPFIELYEGKRPTEAQAEDIVLAIKNGLFEAEAAADLIDLDGKETLRNIIFNILYLGMPSRIEKIAERYRDGCRKDKEDERPL